MEEAAEDGGDEDHDARNSDPCEGVGFGTRAGIDRNSRFNRSQRTVDEREQFRRTDEEYEDKDEDHSCFDAFTEGNSFLIFCVNIELVFRIACRLASAGIEDDDSHDDDGRNHDRQCR